MPVYLYRREDGTTFEVKQKFLDDPLTVDPTTGQRVVRVVQPASVVFKGSGFYVNDSKGKSSTMSTPKANEGKADDAKSDESKSSESAPAAKTESTPAPASKPVASAAAAD
ncbi:MAG: hypothetical protein U0670_13125 [Anaerolineae bacterium]